MPELVAAREERSVAGHGPLERRPAAKAGGEAQIFPREFPERLRARSAARGRPVAEARFARRIRRTGEPAPDAGRVEPEAAEPFGQAPFRFVPERLVRHAKTVQRRLRGVRLQDAPVVWDLPAGGDRERLHGAASPVENSPAKKQRVKSRKL